MLAHAANVVAAAVTAADVATQFGCKCDRAIKLDGISITFYQ
jgi:hypothetical protein